MLVIGILGETMRLGRQESGRQGLGKFFNEDNGFRFAIRRWLAPILAAILLFTVTGAGTAVAQEFYIDPDQTSVIFAVKNFDIGYTYGRFNKTEGEVAIDRAVPKDSKFEFRIHANSVDTNNQGRDMFLRGPEFLQADEFPFVEFKSTTVRFDKPENSKGIYYAKGMLKLHGKQKEIILPIHVTGAGPGKFKKNRIGFLAKFSVDRSEFGLDKLKPNVGERIAITFSAEVVEKDNVESDDSSFEVREDR